ncbi:uridine phosphorylase [Qiania dongpingensis]|uniref:Uridine phosphorylase n=1 Tax=Qiania dongpingensis TaxID=2763669 RepID=A0A7G9G1X3_9FIRM|nr:uridine phosphorylase [Qiania dongpingensis]QNM04805.1 uridine phosphorylase [Qiania dongpingensis]
MDKMYHIGLDDSHGAKYAILPGDPGRVEKIAGYLQNPVFLGQNREYTSWSGELAGERVLVMSTGMGGPSTAIGVEELYQTGVRTMIRVGTCGGMAEQVMGGDLVIANGAIRMEGTSKEYVDIAFPAVADFQVTKALEQAAIDLGARFHLGIVQCKDSFYGQHSPDRMPCGKELEEKWNMWIKAGCLASEMESAALYIAAQILGIRAGCILNVIWNQERKKKGLSDPHCHDTSLAIRAAVHAVELLIKKER